MAKDRVQTRAEEHPQNVAEVHDTPAPDKGAQDQALEQGGEDVFVGCLRCSLLRQFNVDRDSGSHGQVIGER